MARYQATLEYDGTDFAGFQRQREVRTVQGEIEAALRRLGWQGQSILAAGRTDSGVHARGQVIAFDLEWRHEPGDLLRALNANLPADVGVWRVQACAADFHPRYAAQARRYRYTLRQTPARSPLSGRYAWLVWPALDVESMRQASLSLIGRQDFATFGSDPDQGANTVRNVMRAEWRAEAEWLWFDVQADAFLFRMVRSLAGALRKVGTGEWTPAEFETALQARNRALCPPVAPPQGLCLEEVIY